MKTVVISANTSWYLFNFRRNTILELLNIGYKVIAVAPYDDYSFRLKELGATFVNVDIDQGGTNAFKDFRTLFQFVSIYKKNKPDVVLNFTPKNNIYSTIAASISGAKSINNIAGLGLVFVHESYTSKLVRLMYRVSQKKAAKIFFQNNDDLSLFLKYNLAPSSICERIPGSGVDLTRFSVVHPNNDGVVRFLLIARMLYDKGIGHFVEAAATLKSKYGSNVEFNLLGQLDVKNPSAVSKCQMQQWVNDGIVNYLGTSDSVEEVIGNSDCIVLPSFYREGVPKSLLEAGAMGKPIITTDNVGCRETVDEGINGFLCIPRCSNSLISKIESMLNLSHQERIEMGRKSREKVEREFDERVVISKYIEAVKCCF
ncbi:glycosyltransferase family 4 protein [Parasalinivibrio latis]|uniref:glycosyltransferase family 4 protein n=1 Tax=Parasalinivibrio latis TaxID=2952610 RepID=UPI0030E5113D